METNMFDDLKAAVILGEQEIAESSTLKHLKDGADPGDLLHEGLIAGMDVVGERFKNFDMYLPEVLQSAAAMKGAMVHLKPLLAQSRDLSRGKVVMATIEGDVHDIGKNLVCMMLEGAGFEVFDLGVDVTVDDLIKTYRDKDSDMVGISALLTTTMMGLGDAVKIIKNSDSSVKVMVGGAPLTEEFAREVGADGFAPDALRAINLAKNLIER
jgi:5-methyltetrahydrofolate--homocysteine methyltransferase